jgi:hypothetical protein
MMQVALSPYADEETEARKLTCPFIELVGRAGI